MARLRLALASSGLVAPAFRFDPLEKFLKGMQLVPFESFLKRQILHARRRNFLDSGDELLKVLGVELQEAIAPVAQAREIFQRCFRGLERHDSGGVERQIFFG
ncbi:MAG: hypothetical protein AB7U61_07155 [Methylocystis sp.]